jgi:uncharacterized protein with HEPN domain
MQRDQETIRHIFEAACLIQSFTAGMDEVSFNNDVKTQDAVIRRLEIVGEASGRLSKGFRQQMPDIPWQKMKNLRNVLIHAYDDVLLSYIWEIATDHIPPLIENLRPLVPLDEEEDGSLS